MEEKINSFKEKSFPPSTVVLNQELFPHKDIKHFENFILFYCLSGGVEARTITKHSTVHRIVPQQRITLFRMTERAEAEKPSFQVLCNNIVYHTGQ